MRILTKERMMLRVAIIGLGHGASYSGLITGSPRSELTALVDLNAGRLNEMCRKHERVEGFRSLPEMLDAKAADAAIVAVPTPLHAEISIACLDAGLHVLQEKPLCSTDDEAAAILDAVKRNSRVFQAGYEVRSSPLHRAILRHIANGDIGRLTNIWYNQHTFEPAGDTWRSSRGNMGGKLFDCAVHYLDLIQQWAGAPVCRLAALGHRIGRTGVCAEELPESAAIAVEYSNGVRSTYNFGQVNTFGDDASFGVVGTTGRIMGNPWLPEKAGSYELRSQKGLLESNVIIKGNLTSQGHLGFSEQYDNFLDTILEGAPNVCPVEDAFSIHRMMKAADRSLRDGTIVEIKGHMPNERLPS